MSETEKIYDFIPTKTAWLRDYGKDKQEPFKEDMHLVIGAAKNLLTGLES